MKLCICGFNLADAEPNAEGQYFCPWSGHEFEESDVKKAKSTSARSSRQKAPEPEAPAETEPEAPAETEPEAPAETEPEAPAETEPEPETPPGE